jgi:WD40 repeat protein
MVIAIPFLKIHFLHWVEAMSLLGIVSEALAMMGLLQSVAHVSLRPYCSANNRVKSLAWSNKDFETAKFILDLRRFILRNRYVANISPLQLYSSCLIFAPERSEIRSLFHRELPNSIKTLVNVEKLWALELQTLEGHSGAVRVVAFSLTNQVLATGSHDGTIKFWDVTTGSIQQSLEGHLAWVRTIVFSSCGRLLASGPHDSTVKIWDSVTGPR